MLDRRGFLKFIGGAVTGTVLTPVIWKGLDDISIWSQNWGWIPRIDYGNNNFTAVRTVSKLCPSASGITVRLLGGRPIRVIGDSKNPLSLGGVSPLAVTEVQLRYSPARLKRPLRRSGDGSYREISWEAAENLLLEKFRKTRDTKSQGEKMVCISGDENGTMNELLSGITAHMGGKTHFFIMPGEAQATAKAWKMMGGRGRAGFDMEHSDFVLAVGANVLESWGPVMSNRRAWGNAHPIDADPVMKLAYAGPVQNNTATGADIWLPIKPGTELYLLLGIAHLLFRKGLNPAVSAAALKAASDPWTPDKTCARTGLTSQQLEAVVDALQKAKAPVIIAGSAMDQGGGANPIRLAIALNLALGRLNKEGGMRAVPTAAPVVSGATRYEDMMDEDLAAYVSAMSKNSADIDILMIYEANPLYAIPGGKMENLFKKAAFSVAFSCFFDETARRCDLILPSAMGLERYDDVAQPFGYAKYLYTLARPVAEPLYDSRPAGEVLIGIGKKLDMNLGVNSVVEMLHAKANAVGADWNALSNGDTFVSDAVMNVAPACNFSQSDVQAMAGAADAGDNTSGLAVAFVSRLGLGTPESGVPPFSTKTIADTELTDNVLVANVNSATLRKLGYADKTEVVLSSPAGKIKARLHAFEGVTNDTVALTLGFGHKNFDAFNDGKGMNVLDLTAPVAEAGDTGLAVWNVTRVNVAKA